MNRILCFFWAFWWAIAAWTDITGGLKKLGLLEVSGVFADNFDFLAECLAMYALPLWFIIFLFIGIIVWSTLSSLLFFRAGYFILKKQAFHDALLKAYQVSLCLWLVFFLSDQVIMKFDLEANHMIQGGFEFLCFMFFYFVSFKNVEK